jgi:hypothetical protein
MEPIAAVLAVVWFKIGRSTPVAERVVLHFLGNRNQRFPRALPG